MSASPTSPAPATCSAGSHRSSCATGCARRSSWPASRTSPARPSNADGRPAGVDRLPGRLYIGAIQGAALVQELIPGRRGLIAAGVLALGAGLTATAGARADDFTVTNPADSGPGSLRNEIAAAEATPAADRILFASGLTGTIHLATRINFTFPLDIEGPGADQLAISGDGTTKIFGFYPFPVGKPLTISGLTLTGGKTTGIQPGGAVTNNSGAVTIS